jgi:hypothetical protein
MKIKELVSFATPRTLLFYFTVLILLLSVAISELGFALNNPIFPVAGTVVLALWFITIFTAILPKTNIALAKHTKQLKRGALIIFILLLLIGLSEAAIIISVIPGLINNQNISGDFHQLLMEVEDGYKYNDASALSQQAVESLLHGQNPYARSNIIQALSKYNASYDRVTPLRAGSLSKVFPAPQDSQLELVWNKAIHHPYLIPTELESRVCYPAASFLLPAPFIFLGIKDIRVVYAIFFLAGLAYALWVIPKEKRFLFMGVVLISLELWNSLADGGELGNLCFPFLMVAWLAINKNLWLSAICMGLAVATKQTAWFFLPFYFILVFKAQGVKKLMAVLFLVAGIFVVTNLPFVINDPKIWLFSIMSPMTDKMFPLGSGLITLVTSSLLNIQSPLPFTILEGIAFIAAVIWYFKYCPRYPQTGIILATIPLFFAWRSLFSYFFYVDIIALAYVMVNDHASHQPTATNISPAADSVLVHANVSVIQVSEK